VEYRQLGRAGARVSPLCLGGMTFGEADASSMMHQLGSDEDTSFAILNAALDAGINFVDTADVYGNDGLSERVIGRWFARDGRRDELLLASKFRFRMEKGPNGTGASRLRIVRTVEDSLKRLGTDRIDLYQIHMQDADTPEDETLRALDDLVRHGKVVYIGASNYAAYRLVDSLWTSKVGNLERFVTLQAQYSLINRELEREHVPVCRDFGLGILPWSPLAGGFLAGKYRKGEKVPAGTRYEKHVQRFKGFDTERNWRILAALDEVAAEVGGTPAQVALAWLLKKPFVTSVIFGARTLEQLSDNLKAAELKLSNDAFAKVEAASAIDLGYPYAMIAGPNAGRW
jgi:aryl-alcohol dehydrogenase-like predicted oxidoreductase